MKTQVLNIGNQVESSRFGLGTVLEINGSMAKVNFSGEVKDLLLAFLKAPKAAKVKSYMKDDVVEVDTFKSIVNNLKGDRQSRVSSLFVGENIYTKIEKLADAQGHFAGSIIEDARNGKIISEKQACVVAYFAKNNGLI
jgi:hypothetical protein